MPSVGWGCWVFMLLLFLGGVAGLERQAGLHRVGVLHGIDDAAVFAHLQPSARAIRREHCVSGQLLENVVDDASGGKRFAALHTTERGFLIEIRGSPAFA